MKVNIVLVENNTVHFFLDHSGDFVFQIIYKGNVEFETTINIVENVQYYISHDIIRNYGSTIRINNIETVIHENPVINIITRVSRMDLFKDCYNSVKNQTYKNINHILTYETEFIGDDIKRNYDLSNVSLCKVTKLKKLEGLYRSFTYNQYFKQEDLDAWNYKVWDGKEETSERAEKGSTRMKSGHFPYESYMKMAEKRVKEGWVMYLDDDDILYDNNSIELLVENIVTHDIDTIHWFQCYDPSYANETHQTDNGLFPRKYILGHLENDYPPALHSINSSTFIFHSKYLEYTAWEGWYGDDFRTAASLAERIDKNNSIYNPIVNLINGYGHGK
tara:strand:+ start:715 stop:1713 length:999 start_codon:yes stop_codon:yes gene_type:complete